MNAVRENGANVIEVMKGIRQSVADLNASILADNKLILRQVYDETVYIDSSINLVQQNIFVGGALAALMLLIFLRSGGATLVVSLAIPVSVIGAFVAMAAMGRSINVISLAGIAFAVGMVVDAAIVVLENIYRFREKGLSRREAAYRGASQVWGAVFVSALTTVMVSSQSWSWNWRWDSYFGTSPWLSPCRLFSRSWSPSPSFLRLPIDCSAAVASSVRPRSAFQ